MNAQLEADAAAGLVAVVEVDDPPPGPDDLSEPDGLSEPDADEVFSAGAAESEPEESAPDLDAPSRLSVR